MTLMESAQLLGNFGEFVGAIAVVLTLIYLTTQIRQNTTALRSAAAQDVQHNFAGWYSSVQAEPSLLSISAKGMTDLPSLSETEKQQFIAHFMVFCSHIQDAFYKWQEGSLSPELWRGWEYVSMQLFLSPGGKDFWDERDFMFADAFQTYVNDVIMKREPHPKAKPWGLSGIIS